MTRPDATSTPPTLMAPAGMSPERPGEPTPIRPAAAGGPRPLGRDWVGIAANAYSGLGRGRNRKAGSPV